MEKHNPLGYGLNGITAEEQTSCFFTNSNNWDFNPMDQNDPFESALSSMVSSPAASSGGGGGGENVMLRELIGRLGSICSSGEISPHSYNNNIGGNTSTNTTCYSTPLNSPPKLNLSVMDYQIRGNLPFSGTHLAAKTSLIAPFPPDPGFADRAARYSCFAKKDLGCFNGQIGMSDADFGQKLVPKLDSSKISGASSSNWSKNVSGSQMDASIKSGFSVPDMKVSKFSRPTTPENSGIGDSMEISSLTEQITGGQNTINALNEANPRKRKSIAKGKAKEPTSLNSSKDANVASEKTDTNSKRSKSEEDNVEEKDGGTKIKTESNGTNKSTRDGNKKQIKDDDAKDKLAEPPKDYIHVRARRGQATDAHSLAERVRREKISERMKLLQNLVPGCNMVTGKAVMLDEIINYVQSLQHQVEFLSMKLATINPRSDLNVEAHLSKDVISHQGLLHHNIYPSNASVTEFPHSFYPPQGLSMQNTMPNGIEIQYAMNNMNGSTGQNTSIQMPSSDNFGEVPSQVPAFWGNDLHSVVQMGLNQNQTENFHDIMSTAQMKIEQ